MSIVRPASWGRRCGSCVVARMVLDSDPAEVEPVCVPAHLDGHVGFGSPVAVVTARKGQQRGQLARDAGYLSADLLNQSSRARPVRQVMAVVFAFAIVQKGEELHHP